MSLHGLNVVVVVAVVVIFVFTVSGVVFSVVLVLIPVEGLFVMGSDEEL